VDKPLLSIEAHEAEVTFHCCVSCVLVLDSVDAHEAEVTFHCCDRCVSILDFVEAHEAEVTFHCCVRRVSSLDSVEAHEAEVTFHCCDRCVSSLDSVEAHEAEERFYCCVTRVSKSELANLLGNGTVKTRICSFGFFCSLRMRVLPHTNFRSVVLRLFLDLPIVIQVRRCLRYSHDIDSTQMARTTKWG
jgi:hypothetical protein